MVTTPYNSRIDGLAPSASLLLMDKAKEMSAQGVDVISLAGGEPDFTTPKPVIEAAQKSLGEGNTHYVAGRGILPLRKRIARKLREENGIHCCEDNILLTPGGKMGIFSAILALLNPGEEVMILDPSWLSYAPMVTACAGVPVNVALDFESGYEITREKLDACYSEKTKIIILNTPNNPTGRVLTVKEAAVLEEFLKETGIYLIADEVYEKCIFDGRYHISMGSYQSVARQVITMNGFSKCAAMTGWRAGYLCADKEVIDRIFKVSQHTVTCLPGFVQEAALVALDCRQEMEQMRQSFEERRDLFVEGLQSIPGFTCLKPEGAFYAWCRIEKDGMNSMELADYLLEQCRIVAVPGNAYGAGDGGRCVRFSFSYARKDLEEAIRRMREVFS